LLVVGVGTVTVVVGVVGVGAVVGPTVVEPPGSATGPALRFNMKTSPVVSLDT
jgi:hypothetical protein